jgi:hypothetical protein
MRVIVVLLAFYIFGVSEYWKLLWNHKRRNGRKGTDFVLDENTLTAGYEKSLPSYDTAMKSIETPSNYVQPVAQFADAPDPDDRSDKRFTSLNSNQSRRRSSHTRVVKEVRRASPPAPIVTHPPSHFWVIAEDPSGDSEDQSLRNVKEVHTEEHPKQVAFVPRVGRTFKAPFTESPSTSPGGASTYSRPLTPFNHTYKASPTPVSEGGGTGAIPTPPLPKPRNPTKKTEGDGQAYKVGSTSTVWRSPLMATVGSESESDHGSLHIRDDSESESVQRSVESDSDSGEKYFLKLSPGFKRYRNADERFRSVAYPERDYKDEPVAVRVDSVVDYDEAYHRPARRDSRVAADVARVALREWARIEECTRLHSHLPGGLVVDDEGHVVECDCQPLRWGMLDELR